MSEKKFVGKGWQFKYGINISLSKKLLDTIPVNQYGDIKLSVVRRREPDPKTKAQYYVIEDTYVKKQGETKNHLCDNKVDDADLDNFDKDVPF